jgi:4-hydroxy-tetrahydrodipicolinate synthase
MADLCEAALNGDADKARAINEKLMPLTRPVYRIQPDSCEVGAVEMGLMPEGIRLPLTWLSALSRTAAQALRQSGVLV